ncbi:hypothetical protein DFH06DRAFT_1125399 [Mycena polygramma]|nr:hypothetical protein DFH06DRAFT_1125399 [Mycena polygramma]
MRYMSHSSSCTLISALELDFPAVVLPQRVPKCLQLPSGSFYPEFLTDCTVVDHDTWPYWSVDDFFLAYFHASQTISGYSGCLLMGSCCSTAKLDVSKHGQFISRDLGAHFHREGSSGCFEGEGDVYRALFSTMAENVAVKMAGKVSDSGRKTTNLPPGGWPSNWPSNWQQRPK